MRSAVFFILFLAFNFFTSAQNLVGNKGFEERNLCIEYTQRCAPEAWFFLPRYTEMSPIEEDGNNYEIILMGNALRPFSVGNNLYTKMFCELIAGEKYTLKMRVNTRGFEFDYIDIWIAESEPWRGKYSFSNIKPSLKIKADSVIGNNLKEWRDLSFTFTASGGERFIMLGNISQEPLMNARKKARKNDRIEYWIDDVELTAINPALNDCPQYEAIKDQVYRNDFRHPGRFIDDIELDTALIKKPERKETEPPVLLIPKTDTLIIPDVLFKFDKSDLNPKFITRLDSFVNAIQSRAFTKLLVTGHTDNFGKDEYNLKLSQERANTIKAFLLSKLMINADVIETKGYGESQPRSTNETAQGRQLNRRVEIIIYY